MRALERHGFNLDEQLRTRQAGDTATHRDRTALPEPRRSFTVGAIHLGAMHREGTAPDDVIERGASLGQSPLHAGMGKIVLSGHRQD
jgi:hypothetical protein